MVFIWKYYFNNERERERERDKALNKNSMKSLLRI